MENPLSCVIVEDEPIAIEILKDYIDQVQFLECIASFPDALQASDCLGNQSVDVLFLDIHLPGIKGLDFLKSLPNPPQTILTTAYHQYALEAFDANAVDYLMKPIPFPRFLQAVHKLNRTQSTRSERPFRFINVNKKNIRIYLDEVVYIESLKDYCRIVTTKERYVTRGHLGLVKTWFPDADFMRTHRSFLVNLKQVQAFSASEIELEDGSIIPIGRSHKTSVQVRLSALVLKD